jgi:4-hydroxybenzoate polyprenyltransferase
LKGALNIARFLHLCMLGIWAWMIHYAQFQWPFWSALGLIMILVVIQHLMVKIDDLKRMNLVFFKLNVGISLIILLGALVEVNV